MSMEYYRSEILLLAPLRHADNDMYVCFGKYARRGSILVTHISLEVLVLLLFSENLICPKFEVDRRAKSCMYVTRIVPATAPSGERNMSHGIGRAGEDLISMWRTDNGF